MNHKIKMFGDWKVSTIPDLIYRIRDIHEFQRIDIRGALHGRGIYNFQIGQTTLVLCMLFGLT
jgi:hypothetical protein